MFKIANCAHNMKKLMTLLFSSDALQEGDFEVYDLNECKKYFHKKHISIISTSIICVTGLRRVGCKVS